MTLPDEQASGASLRAAVFGDPIEHSLSPVLHNAGYAAAGLADWQFERQRCAEHELAERVPALGAQYQGFAVTMPCKFAAAQFASQRSARVQALGVANTLVRRPEGWFAENTDVDGVIGALTKLLGDVQKLEGTQAVVVGAGGTARTVVWTLAQLGVASIVVINRSDRLAELQELVAATATRIEYVALSAAAEQIAQRCSDAALVVNTVPAANLAGIEASLAHAPLFDVIYDPWPTPLIRAAQSAGHATVGGHVMLAHQAFTQFALITGHEAPRDAMWEALEKHLGISH